MIWRWENYVNAFSSDISMYFMNSVIYTTVTIVVSGLLSAMAAYAITRMQWKFNKAVLILFLVGIMVPIHAALLPLFIVLDKVRLLDTYWALLIPYIAFALPMNIFILTSFMRQYRRNLKRLLL